MDVPADLDLHWSHTRKYAYIWRKELKVVRDDFFFMLTNEILSSISEIYSISLTVPNYFFEV